MKALLLLLVRAYRVAISPLFPPRCRFLPSCSDYALQAVERHGAVAGGWLALRRFVRCNPLNPGGIDEVPDNAGGWFAGRGASDPGPQQRSGWHGGGLRRIVCRCHGMAESVRRDPSNASEAGDPAAAAVPAAEVSGAAVPAGNRSFIHR